MYNYAQNRVHRGTGHSCKCAFTCMTARGGNSNDGNDHYLTQCIKTCKRKISECNECPLIMHSTECTGVQIIHLNVQSPARPQEEETAMMVIMIILRNVSKHRKGKYQNAMNVLFIVTHMQPLTHNG